jgi:hypothetical protein
MPIEIVYDTKYTELRIQYDGRLFTKAEFFNYIGRNGNGSLDGNIGFCVPFDVYEEASSTADEIRKLMKPAARVGRRV